MTTDNSDVVGCDKKSLVIGSVEKCFCQKYYKQHLWVPIGRSVTEGVLTLFFCYGFLCSVLSVVVFSAIPIWYLNSWVFRAVTLVVFTCVQNFWKERDYPSSFAEKELPFLLSLHQLLQKWFAKKPASLQEWGLEKITIRQEHRWLV